MMCWSRGENNPSCCPATQVLINVYQILAARASRSQRGPALVVNSLCREDGEAYDVRARCPNRKFRFNARVTVEAAASPGKRRASVGN
jgi:hypothetical protein